MILKTLISKKEMASVYIDSKTDARKVLSISEVGDFYEDENKQKILILIKWALFQIADPEISTLQIVLGS